MPRPALTIGLALAVVLGSSAAAADPELLPREHVVVESAGATIQVPREDGPRIFVLPVGSHVLAASSWERLDAEFRRLQAAEVRLTAENASFRASAAAWQPGWRALAVTLAAGLVAGGVGYWWLAR